MLDDLLIVLGLVLTAYFVQYFQRIWVSNEYEAATFLKLNDRKAFAVFSLAFLGSVSVFAGTVFTGLGMSSLNSYAFNLGLLFYMVFFLLLNSISSGGEHFWEHG